MLTDFQNSSSTELAVDFWQDNN